MAKQQKQEARLVEEDTGEMYEGRCVTPVSILLADLFIDAAGNLYELDEVRRGEFVLRLYRRAGEWQSR